MTLLEVILTAAVFANIVFDGVILFLLRDALHTRRARGSVRRLWQKVERKT